MLLDELSRAKLKPNSSSYIVYKKKIDITKRASSSSSNNNKILELMIEQDFLKLFELESSSSRVLVNRAQLEYIKTRLGSDR